MTKTIEFAAIQLVERACVRDVDQQALKDQQAHPAHAIMDAVEVRGRR